LSVYLGHYITLHIIDIVRSYPGFSPAAQGPRGDGDRWCNVVTGYVTLQHPDIVGPLGDSW